MLEVLGNHPRPGLDKTYFVKGCWRLVRLLRSCFFSFLSLSLFDWLINSQPQKYVGTYFVPRTDDLLAGNAFQGCSGIVRLSSIVDVPVVCPSLDKGYHPLDTRVYLAVASEKLHIEDRIPVRKPDREYTWDVWIFAPLH